MSDLCRAKGWDSQEAGLSFSAWPHHICATDPVRKNQRHTLDFAQPDKIETAAQGGDGIKTLLLMELRE